MNLEQVVTLFREKPYFLKMGKGLLSKRLHCEPDIILLAKDIIHKEGIKKKINTPKILVLDIETAPIRAFVWKLWKENVGLNQIQSDWFIICWSAKWLFSSEVISSCVTPKEALAEDDRRICIEMAKLLNEADIVITHNGVAFDMPKLYTRFLQHKLPPVKSLLNIDTCIIAKKQFAFTSNKLDYLANIFGLENKLETNFTLWSDCLRGDLQALNYMVQYNKYDVELLEAVYLRLRPYIKNHPNMALFFESDTPVCPNCGSTHLTPNGFYYTTVNKYQAYQCECGAICRVRTSSLSKEISSNILTNNIR